MLKIILLITFTLFFHHPCMADESVSYAKKARATWSAFQCAALAEKAGKKSEQIRLFTYGYNQGKEFLNALQEGKIKQEDLSSNAPVSVLLLLQGPTLEFMLGRIFEYALDDALDEVFKDGDRFRSDEEQSLIATNKFSSSNCQLIGDER